MEEQQTDNLQSSDASIGPVANSAPADATMPSQTAVASEPVPAETSSNVNLAPDDASSATRAPAATPDAAPAASTVSDVPENPSSIPDASPAETEQSSPLPPTPHKREGIEENSPPLASPTPIPDTPLPVTPKSDAPAAIPIITALLTKARAAIQNRKQKKLLKILKLVETNKTITNDDIEKFLRCSDATATRYIGDLIKQGKLERVGPKNHARYRIRQ